MDYQNGNSVKQNCLIYYFRFPHSTRPSHLKVCNIKYLPKTKCDLSTKSFFKHLARKIKTFHSYYRDILQFIKTMHRLVSVMYVYCFWCYRSDSCAVQSVYNIKYISSSNVFILHLLFSWYYAN